MSEATATVVSKCKEGERRRRGFEPEACITHICLLGGKLVARFLEVGFSTPASTMIGK
jgi:hypothetical protein